MKTKVVDVGVKVDEELELEEEIDDEDEDWEDDDEEPTEEEEMAALVTTILSIRMNDDRNKEWFICERDLESVLECIEREDPCFTLLTEAGGTLYMAANIVSLSWRKMKPEETAHMTEDDWKLFTVIEAF
jgi:hypothetical protein